LTLSSVLRDRREQLQLSQSDLARISGLHRSYIGDLERGSRNVSVRNLSRLAAAVNLSASKLLSMAEKEMTTKKPVKKVAKPAKATAVKKVAKARKAVAKKPVKSAKAAVKRKAKAG